MDPDAVDAWKHSWHDAAQWATFTPYEAVDGPATLRRAGGYGCDPEVAISLHVVSTVDGVEVDVETTVPNPHQTSSGRWRRLAHEVVSQFTVEQDDFVLPFTLTVVGDDREIAVEGDPVVFSGVRIDGESRWMGLADVDGRWLVVSAGADVDFTIRRCVDGADLPVLTFDTAE